MRVRADGVAIRLVQRSLRALLLGATYRLQVLLLATGLGIAFRGLDAAGLQSCL